MKSALIIDFDDSFTHNLMGLFFSCGFEVTCLHWQELAKKDWEKLTKNYDVLVLGPGPGHPKEYGLVSNFLEQLKEAKVLGVCLGHQILLSYLNGDLIQLDHPLHGQSLELEKVGEFLSIDKLKAQFYNSWAIDSDKLKSSPVENLHVIEIGKMTVLFQKDNWLGVQFHPESVGTSCPEEVLKKLLMRMGV